MVSIHYIFFVTNGLECHYSLLKKNLKRRRYYIFSISSSKQKTLLLLILEPNSSGRKEVVLPNNFRWAEKQNSHAQSFKMFTAKGLGPKTNTRQKKLNIN